MPIFEYACDACHQHFELLVRSDTRLACPHCQSTALTKQLSVFATASSDAGTPAMAAPGAGFSPCGSCGHPEGPGACSMH